MSDRELKKIKCFCCGKELEIDWYESYRDEPDILVPVYDGLWFESAGNYGSTIYDPIDNDSRRKDRIRIVICDECVTKKKDEVTRIVSYEKWKATAEPFVPGGSTDY